MILYPGVNIELLEEMQKMSIEDRLKTCLDMDDITFCKFVLRMGYNLDEVGDNKRTFIQEVMLSDSNLIRVLNEQKESDLELEV